MSDTGDTSPTSPLLAALMARTGGGPVLPANSRYQGCTTRTWEGPDGNTTVYLSRRLVPQPSRFATIESHVMGSDERLDQVAAMRLGDPLLAWRLADANNALDPAELEHRGRLVRLTLPEGIPVGMPSSRNA